MDSRIVLVVGSGNSIHILDPNTGIVLRVIRCLHNIGKPIHLIPIIKDVDIIFGKELDEMRTPIAIATSGGKIIVADIFFEPDYSTVKFF